MDLMLEPFRALTVFTRRLREHIKTTRDTYTSSLEVNYVRFFVSKCLVVSKAISVVSVSFQDLVGLREEC